MKRVGCLGSCQQGRVHCTMPGTCGRPTIVRERIKVDGRTVHETVTVYPLQRRRSWWHRLVSFFA